MRQPSPLPVRGTRERAQTPGSSKPALPGAEGWDQGRGLCVSRREVRPPLRSHAYTSRRQLVGPAGSLAGGRSGAGRQRADWRAVEGGVHALQRFLVQCCSCACGWSARGGAERSRLGRGGVGPGRAGAGASRAGAGMPLFFSALLALLLVALGAVFLGR